MKGINKIGLHRGGGGTHSSITPNLPSPVPLGKPWILDMIGNFSNNLFGVISGFGIDRKFSFNH